MLYTADNQHKGFLKESLGKMNDMINVFVSASLISRVKKTDITSHILLHKATVIPRCALKRL